MKKTLRIMGFCALMALAAVSCKKNEHTNGKTIVEAVITQPTSNAKTGIVGLNLVWHSGDAIEVFNANDLDDCAIFTTTGSGITATFTSESDMEVSDGYFAFYPYEDITTPDGSFDLALNVEQVGVANTFGPKVYPMYATFASGKFQFHSPCGLLAIPLKGTGTIGSIVLTGNANEYLCGDYFFSTNDMAHPSLVGYKKYITLTFSDGLQLSDESQTVYFALPAGVFANGFTAVINNMGGNEIYTLGTTKDNTIVAEYITLMPTVSIAAIDVTTGAPVVDDVPTTVTLNGSYIAPTGMSVSEVGFYFGRGVDLTKYQATLGTTFSLVREGLDEGIEYTYQAYAMNGNNEILGSVVTFTTGTSVILPSVTTTSITNITSTAAMGGGTITSDGGGTISECGVCWSTSSNPTIADHHALGQLNEDSFAVNMTGLSDGVRYYVRAFATNEAGTTYGAQKTFKTLEGGSHGWVDLGLPSGTLWATCNIGANSPEKAGSYLIYYQARTYNLPSLTQWTELRNNTESTWGTLNGVNGYYFTSANGNSIFLPAAGYSYVTGYSSQTTISDNGSQGYYWSNSVVTGGVSMFSFKSSGFVGGTADYSMGLSVRTVHAAF